MTRTPTLAALAALAGIAACTGPEPRVATPITVLEERVAVRYRAIELLEVSLPAYAAAEGIAVEGGGIIETSDDVLWDDDPTRGVTLTLARHLTAVTGARIAPEPWPFDTYPEARVDVRIEQLLATDAGIYRMAGQYFVAPLDGRGPDRAALFALEAPLASDSAQAIVVSRDALVAELALLIAREGLR